MKIFGVCWDIELDEMLFDFKELIEYVNILKVIKRFFFKLFVKVFDFFGFLSLFIIMMKCEF